jgi:hypothetical protein
MKSSNPQHESNKRTSPRQIKDAPFCWQHKGTLKMIRDVFENGHGHAALALCVYVALTELASDNQSETFSARISEIARRAGVSYRTAFAFLKRFESVKLIAVKRLSVEGTKERLPSIYTLLPPLCTPCLTLGKREASRLPRRLKNRNNQNKNDDTRGRTGETATAKQGDNSSSSFLNLEETKKHPLWKEFEAYCKSKSGSPTLKGFNTWLKSQSFRNGAAKTSKPLPIAKRDKIINEPNRKKKMIYRTFPDGKFAPWATERMAAIDRQLQKL